VATNTQTKTQKHSTTALEAQYKVIMHNDDITTMEFVVRILQQIFDKSKDEATRIMFDIHNNGEAVCGIYDKETAWAKKLMVETHAKRENFPLKCTIEKE